MTWLRSHGTNSPLAVAVLVAAGFWVVDLAWLCAGAPDPLDDTWDYGVASRHLLAGEGYRTSVIHPPVWSLRDTRLTVPILVHGPLMPVLLAPLVKVRGANAIDAVAWIGALFAVLALVPTVRLARRMFGNEVAITVAALFTLSPVMITAVHHDPSLVVGAFLAMLALDLLLRPMPRPVAAGFALGFAALVRPEMILASIILILFGPRGARLRFGGPVLACLAPWWIHVTRASGVPFFSLSSYLLLADTERYPGLSVLRDFHLTPWVWSGELSGAAPELFRKWLSGAPRAAWYALTAPSVATGVLALIGFARMAWRPDIAQGTRAIVLLAAIPLVLMTATEHNPRYVAPFLALWSIAASVGARDLLSRVAPGRSPRIVLSAVLVLLLPSTVTALVHSHAEARALRVRLADERASLQARARSRIDATSSSRPMFSDTPDFVAWTTDRSVIYVTRDEYLRLPEAARDTGWARAVGVPSQGGDDDTWFHDPAGAGVAGGARRTSP